MKQFKKLEIRFAGAGGQGLQAAATILGKSLIQSTDLYVCQSQNYGPESRGGLSYADLIVSHEEIDFPKIKNPNVLVCMSNESFLHFEHLLLNDTLSYMLVDPEMVPVIRLPEGKLQVVLHRISATLISEDIFGSRIGSNVVLVGALHAILKIGDSGCIEAVLKEEWPDLAEKNITAFRKGIAVVNSSETS